MLSGPLVFQKLFLPAWRDVCQPACPLAAGFTSKTALDSLEESAKNLRTIVMNHFVFRQTLCPVPSAHQIFVFYSRYIFIPLIHSAHYCAFHTFCLHQFFSFVYYNYHENRFFSYAFDRRQARNLILIFNYSSQRPHLNYILLSKVYSFELK